MIGIDVGGANLKVVDEESVHIHYCPLWKGAPLADLLTPYQGGAAAVVMSGELADSFSCKMDGICHIVDAIKSVFRAPLFYGTDGRFHTSAVPQLAAANWLASADWLRERYPEAVFLDIGSTTTDIIPLPLYNEMKGMTDLRRLQGGYLIYTGMLRTNLAAHIRSVEIDGIRTPVSTEYFAASADAHLVLGHIRDADYTCPAPDWGGATYQASLRRLARVVCADPDEIGERGAIRIAERFWEVQREIISKAVQQVMGESGADMLLTCGIGSALFARELNGRDLREEMGEASDALPAYAVREVALRSA